MMPINTINRRENTTTGLSNRITTAKSITWGGPMGIKLIIKITINK